MAYFQTDNLWVNQLAEGVADLVIDVPQAKVNALNRPVLLDLERALERVEQNDQFQVLIVRSGKAASFCAGPDAGFLAELKPEEYGALADLGRRVFARLAGLSQPSVAMIAGACLGGGLELALACDYRVAVEKPSTLLGFSDVEMGLIPMWGGTQRLPRIVGVDRALHLLLGGKRIGARQARDWGLVDDLARENRDQPPEFLRDAHKRSLTKLPLRTLRQKLFESHRLGRWLIFRGAERLLRTRLPDDMPAPWESLETVRVGLREGMEAGLARERTAAITLADSETCRNLIRLHKERDAFRVTHAAAKQADRIRRLGIVGAGSRGAALVYMAVTKGCQVVIKEANEQALGFAMVRMLSLFNHEVASGTMSAAVMLKNMHNIRGTTAWVGFDDLDLVLEAIEEDVAKKSTLFKQLEKNTPAAAILASTGAAVTPGQLQEGLNRPERVAGLHFLPPLGRSLLVEVAASPTTSPDTVRRLMHFVGALGRVPRLVKDQPGFLVQRLLVPYFNEAILLVKEGMNPQRVDEAMTRFGMGHGPLEQLDMIGLDVAAPLVKALEPILQPRIPLESTFADMVRKQWLGQKAGVGFYTYRGRRQKVNHALVSLLRAESQTAAPHRMQALSTADQLALARDRLVWMMVNEAAWCLQEGLADSADDLDLTLTLGGWAPYRGGPLHYARHVGIEEVTQRLAEMASQYGPRYQPCPWFRLK